MAGEQNYKPAQPNVYQGKQIVINSDRVLFNAKEDSVLVYADKSIGLDTNGTINFDTGTNESVNRFVVNSPNIHLGLIEGKNPPTEPALLGDKTEKWLNDMLIFLERLIQFLATRYTVTVPLVGISAPGPNDISGLMSSINDLRTSIEDIKSKNVKLI